MNCKHIGTLLGIGSFLLMGAATSHAVIIGFEDLATPPALDSSTGMQFANGSLNYSGVIWDSRVSVTGIDYSVPGSGGAPLFSAGAPGGGNYYITNNTDETGNPATTDGNGITLTTSMVLMGAYFGAVELYGYYPGEGAYQVTILAMADAVVLDSLTFDLLLNLETDGPENTPVGMTYFDTSAFAALSGITGYVINRTPNPNIDEPGFTGWVADDFNFVAVPEPQTTTVLALAAALLGTLALRRRLASQA